jgi:hypothetical protein
MLFLLLTLGVPCLVQRSHLHADRPEDFKEMVPGVPSILFVLLGLAVGVFLAAVYGGMSRWIARRHGTDLLTVFFGGVLGAVGLMMLSGCLAQISLILVEGMNRGSEQGIGMFVIIGAVLLAHVRREFGRVLVGWYLCRSFHSTPPESGVSGSNRAGATPSE